MSFNDPEDNDYSFRTPSTCLSVLSENYVDAERSVEKPRRGISEQPLSRLSRRSIGSISIKDHVNDLSEAENTTRYDRYVDGSDMVDQLDDELEDNSLDEASGLK